MHNLEEFQLQSCLLSPDPLPSYYWWVTIHTEYYLPGAINSVLECSFIEAALYSSIDLIAHESVSLLPHAPLISHLADSPPWITTFVNKEILKVLEVTL